MGLFAWFDKKIKKMRWFDISLTKLSVAGIVLAIAVLWPPLLTVGWKIYLGIGIVAGALVFYRMFTP